MIFIILASHLELFFLKKYTMAGFAFISGVTFDPFTKAEKNPVK